MSSPGDATAVAGVGPGAAAAPRPWRHRGRVPTVPAWLVALRMRPLSLLPRDRLIEQLYGEIAALKEELENFKAEVGDSHLTVSRGDPPCGYPGVG